MPARALVRRWILLLVSVAAAAVSSRVDAAESPTPSAPAREVDLDAYAGVGGYGTFAGRYAGGLEVAGHGERVAWSVFGEGAFGSDGHVLGVGGSVGEVLGTLGPVAIQVHLLGGEHWYSDVHAIAPAVDPRLGSCSGLPGASGATPYLGVRLGIAPVAREGARFFGGLWLDAAEDLLRGNQVVSGTVLCAGAAGSPTQTSRSVDAPIGGWHVGLALRLGWSIGT